MNFCKFLYCYRQSAYVSLLSIGLLTGSYSNCYSAFEKTEVGAWPNSMGNAVVALPRLSHAIYYNPAALTDSKSLEVILSYLVFFEMKDLSEIDLVINSLLAGHPVSCALNQFGNEHYRETQVSIGSKYIITPMCVLGASLHYYQLRIAQYGQESTWGLNLALLCSLIPELKLGALVSNINKPRISREAEMLPQTMSLGLSYKPVATLTICFSMFRDIRFSQDFRAGLSYQAMPALAFRAGVEDRLNIYTLGLGIFTNWIKFDYALKVHAVLGSSHVFTMMVVL